MTKYGLGIFSSVWFIAALLILLLNDFVLKALFHNFITGKLSDFAGLFVFIIFWITVFPKYKKQICFIIAVMFILWKSEHSQQFIDFWNNYFFQINRVVDYTDLSALIVLPLAYNFSKQSVSYKIPKLNPIISIFLSVFAFSATSYYTEVKVDKIYNFPFPKDSLEKRIFFLPSIDNYLREEYKQDSLKQLYLHSGKKDTVLINSQKQIKTLLKIQCNCLLLQTIVLMDLKAT